MPYSASSGIKGCRQSAEDEKADAPLIIVPLDGNIRFGDRPGTRSNMNCADDPPNYLVMRFV
ncbi:hypothetical protein X773_14925 [Mesorhizobium sp. LSJC285A00]|nr:hypothetical protein X773_14925 [Mesorhizobium sp. LSJC285A00]